MSRFAFSEPGDSVQQLFGGVEPTSKMLADHYREQPELAAYLTARALQQNSNLGHHGRGGHKRMPEMSCRKLWRLFMAGL